MATKSPAGKSPTTKQTKPNNTAADFEKSLTELEDLVAALETGDLTLEESLKTFAQGIALTRNCQTALQAAEQKVQMLLEQDGGILSEDFDKAPLK